MNARARKSNSIVWYVVLGLAVVIVVGLATYFLASRGAGKSEEPQGPLVTVRPVPGEPQRDVTIYLPVQTGGSVVLAPTTKTVSAKGGILDAAMQALIEEGARATQGTAVIPTGTKLLKPIDVKRGTAVVDLSTEFVDNFEGGSDQEALTLNAIAFTLAYYKDEKVSRVRILVGGNPAESLGGHFDLGSPITADPSLLKPEK